MKYRETDITLVKSNKIYRFNDFLPSKDFMYIKVLKDGKIIACYGDIMKKMFGLKNKKMIDKNIKSLTVGFFSDFIYNLKEKSAEDCSSYQFIFQYKDSVEDYSCSIYPCAITDKCFSFDVIVRKIVNERDFSFVSLL